MYLTENRLSWNGMCCAADNHNYMCHSCAKEFLDSNLNEAVNDKISNFHEIAQNSTYSHKLYFLKYICNFLDQLLHPYKCHGRDLSGIVFFIFASCKPLRQGGSDMESEAFQPVTKQHGEQSYCYCNKNALQPSRSRVSPASILIWIIK